MTETNPDDDDFDIETLRPALSWTEDHVPVSDTFEDPYYNAADGLAETTHVFLDGNDLPARFAPNFHIAELGFGTGLNFLATWKAWIETDPTGALYYTAFEANPMAMESAARALAEFQDLWRQRGTITARWDDLWWGRSMMFSRDVHLSIVLGDARETVPDWRGLADAWYLDGFSPAKNPEMWEPELMKAVAKRTAPGGSFSSYTAAGDVRRALDEAGFEVERVPGYGTKKHMIRGRLR